MEWIRTAVIIGGGVALAHLLDPWGVTLHAPDARAHDWHRLLRVSGSIVTWLVAGVALWLHDRDGSRAGRLVLCAGLSGLAAEVLKVVIRRGRPEAAFEGYGFLGWEGAWWNTAALGLPSSHAAVAFGAAWALLRLSPRGGFVAVAVAIGCGATRVLDRAHFISDVAMAAGIAWFVTAALWKRWPRS